MKIFYLRLTSVNWCGKVTINGNMYRDQIPGALLCTRPASMRKFKSLFFPTVQLYFIAETWSVDFLFLSRPHIFIKTSQCIKKLSSWYSNNFSLIITLQFLLLQRIMVQFLFLSELPEEWCQDEFCTIIRICFFRSCSPYILWALTVFWTAWRFCNTNNCYF